MSDEGMFVNMMKMIPPGMQIPGFIQADTSLHSAYGHVKGAYPLDMSQFENLFNSTRIPQKGKDIVVKADSVPPYHIVVQRGPHFFRVQVTTEDGTELPPSSLRAAFQAIIDGSGSDSSASADADADAPPVGILTTQDRDSWADARQGLESNSTNAATLAAIDEALFIVCLDDSSPESKEDVMSVMLHGDGRDRW
jgi:carnitine O-palmitoyltransferase 2